jgi:MFS superfamily sulfate permease-like transporter
MSDPREKAAPQVAGRPPILADVLSGFLVFLIALPLCLGIAMASGFPPIAGIVTAVVGGMLASFLGSAPLTIKGPAAGLIVIALGAVQELGEGDQALGYHRALATIAVAAVIQIGFALARAGTLGDTLPSSVVHGMLAAIGVIIISKQAHTLLGVVPAAKEPLGLLLELPHSIAELNPEIALIGILGLLILFLLPLVKPLRRVPGPLIVVALAMVLGNVFDLAHAHTYSFENHEFSIGPKFLVQLPGSLVQAIALPDFSVIFSATSLEYITMFALVGSIESLLSTKAVEQLDPERRRADLDKDLLAVGISNLVCGLIGGLPMISEIVRSSANIANGAKSRWSNFFHGAFLAAFVVFLPGLLQRIPLAALAAMLIYTGFRLASPREFVKTWRIGPEQLAIFTFTLVLTLATDLLVGVAGGVLFELLVHLYNGMPLKAVFKPEIKTELAGQSAALRVGYAAVFSNYLTIKKAVASLPAEVRDIQIDLSRTGIVDHTVMERLHDLASSLEREGRSLRVTGLEEHRPFTQHDHAARRRQVRVG